MKQTQGILIAQVSKDSPAEKAGLKRGDVIVAYQGKPVLDVGDFRNRVSLTRPGSHDQLTIIRNGKRQEIKVTIGKLSEDQVLAQTPAETSAELGLTVQTLTPELAQQFDVNTREGVVVTQVERGSIAAMAGISAGTVILQVNQKPVKSAAQFNRAVKENSGKKRLLLLVRTGDMQQYLVLSW